MAWSAMSCATNGGWVKTESGDMDVWTYNGGKIILTVEAEVHVASTTWESAHMSSFLGALTLAAGGST